MILPKTHSDRQVRPRGALLTECLVAAGVLTGAIGVIVPLVVQQGRLLADCRAKRLALDELSNQLDALTMLAPAALPERLERLDVSPRVADALGEAKLAAELRDDDDGARVVLTLRWTGPHGEPQARSLTGWIVAPADDDAADAAAGEAREPARAEEASP